MHIILFIKYSCIPSNLNPNVYWHFVGPPGQRGLYDPSLDEISVGPQGPQGDVGELGDRGNL